MELGSAVWFVGLVEVDQKDYFLRRSIPTDRSGQVVVAVDSVDSGQTVHLRIVELLVAAAVAAQTGHLKKLAE